MCIHDKNIKNWFPLTTKSLDNNRRVLDQNGVYFIRTNKPFKRLKGHECNILYIGQGNLYNRLWCLADLSKKWIHSAQKRVKDYKKNFPSAVLTFSFVITKNSKDKEWILISKYNKEHLELPPFNHQH